jgi:plastocyanin
VNRRAASALLVASLLALVLVPLLGIAPASAAAKTITISLTANGPKPAATTAAVGDSVVFRNDDQTFVHQVSSASTNWSFNSPPLAPGQTFPAGKLAKPGTYVYRGANLDSFTGKVVVPGGTTASAAPTPSRSAAPAPSRSASPKPSAAPTSASPSPTGGSGQVGPPPLAGGFGSVGAPTPPAASAGAPAPNVAPTLAGEEPVVSAEPSGPAVAIGHGRLPEPPTGRRYGLPAALAAVAAAGVASLLIRLLLAHPAAKRAKHARGRDVAITVD